MALSPEIDKAITQARTIQADLEAGTLTPPFPPRVRADLRWCEILFSGSSLISDDAAEIVRRLSPEVEETRDQVDLPW